jgi:hypothetical protein
MCRCMLVTCTHMRSVRARRARGQATNHSDRQQSLRQHCTTRCTMVHTAQIPDNCKLLIVGISIANGDWRAEAARPGEAWAWAWRPGRRQGPGGAWACRGKAWPGGHGPCGWWWQGHVGGREGKYTKGGRVFCNIRICIVFCIVFVFFGAGHP